MAEVIAVEGDLTGFAMRGDGTHEVTVPKGDYRVEKAGNVGSRLLLCPLRENDWHYAVPINTLKTARALGRIRFVKERQPPAPPENHIADSVEHLLAGGNIEEAIAQISERFRPEPIDESEPLSSVIMEEVAKAMVILDRLDKYLNSSLGGVPGQAQSDRDKAIQRIRKDVVLKAMEDLGTNKWLPHTRNF